MLMHHICEKEFYLMEDYLQHGIGTPLSDFFLYNQYRCSRCRHGLNRENFIIVCVEDYERIGENNYTLLIDFYTIFDYLRFEAWIGNEHVHNDNNGIPRSTFIRVDNYISPDAPIKDMHYHLDLSELGRRMVSNEPWKDEGFPLLYTLSLGQELRNSNAPLLYQAGLLVYPQWVFRSFHAMAPFPVLMPNGNRDLIVYDVWQGNYNEIKEGNEAKLVFDAGTEVLGGTVSFYTLLGKLQGELTNGLPLFVLSHWHTDHYSLLFALSDTDLRKIHGYVFPSYVKNLSVFLFVLRLKIIGRCVTMINLPYNSPWMVHTQNGCAMRLYANKYVKSSTNNSGLTVFVEGATNYAMLSGDCRYRLVENQANEAIRNPMGQNHTQFLVVPHHGGHAGKVTYRIANAQDVVGIVSVGFRNRHSHPNGSVLRQLGTFVRAIERTDLKGDMKFGL